MHKDVVRQTVLSSLRKKGEVGMKEIIIEVPDDFGKTLKPEKVNSEIKGEIVRCKDCRWYIDGICEKWGFRHPDDYFCSDAERMGRSVKWE